MSAVAERPLRFDPLVWASTLAAAVVFVVLYGFVDFSSGYNENRVPVLGFARQMWKLEDWQHCWFVPLASFAIIWMERKKLATLAVKGTWMGFPVVLLALAIFWFGYQADVIYFGYISAQLLIAGLILFFFGWQWMRALAFPWLFLIFMWPLLFLADKIGFPLRMIMSKASAGALNALGVPVTLQGTAILSAPTAFSQQPLAVGERFSVDVANPCSGIRSLFALMMVSALIGYFMTQGWWRRWFIFGCSLPLAVLGNLCRILMLVFGTILFGPQIAIGTEANPSFFHMLSGYVVFIVALFGMLGIVRLLNSDWPALWEKFRAKSRAERTPAASPRRREPGTRIEDVY